MNTPQILPSRSISGWRTGLTLIEVIAGTVLAGTLLVGMLLAMTSHARQLQQLKLSQAGLRQLDQFLSNWAQSDFSDLSLADLAKNSALPIFAGTRPLADSQEESTDLWIRLTIERLPELRTWNLDRVRIEALSRASGKAVAKLEIVRYAR